MPATDLSRRLTAQDASFLYVEKPNLPMHGGSLGTYDGRISRDEVAEAVAERLHLLPRFRQRAVFPPFNINHPTWEDDTNFDIDYHIVERTIPAPGDDRATSVLAGEILAPPLDRSRPLWKIAVLQGREDRNTALLWLTHHCMVDGVSGVDISLVVHDLTPDAAPPAPPATPWQPRPMPDALTLMQDAMRDSLRDAAASWTDQTFNQLRPTVTAERTQQMASAMSTSLPYALQPAPRAPFNSTISNRRNAAWFECTFAEIRGIRAALGGTVNDVVLAVDAGALRRYLRAHGYPVDGVELRAMCPVSMRAPEGQGALGNQVSMMIAPLYVGIADPIERLKAEREAMERLKTAGQAAAFYAMADLSRNTPAPMQMWAMQGEVQNTLLNTVSTNVPGPQIPLYLRGHELLHSHGLGMLSAGIGLFIAIGSYNQLLSFGLVADPTLVPDVWFAADCFRESFNELREAAGVPAAIGNRQSAIVGTAR